MSNRIQAILEKQARRAKKVEQLVELLRDPDLADIVAQLEGGEQTGMPFERSVTPITSRANGRPTSLRGVIRELNSLPQRFTIKDVLPQVQAHGFTFGKTDPEVAVRDALYTLSRPGDGQVFRVTTPSSGGSLQIYERVAS